MKRSVLSALAAALALILVAAPGSAHASFDVADLYLRKIRVGEKTFFADGGWQRWRTRNDFFYETDLIAGAGVGDPRQVRPDSDDESDGTALTSWSFGDLLLLSDTRSPLQLTFFTMHSTTFKEKEDSGMLPWLFLALPMLAADGAVIYQGLTGFQLRVGDWIEGAYGVLMDVSNGVPQVNSFFQANLPIAFFNSSAVLAPSSGQVERLQLGFRYDEAEWMNYAEVGRLVQNYGGEKTFYYAGIDGAWNVLAADVRVSDSFELAYGRVGVHYASVDHVSPALSEITNKPIGKFSSAWDVRAMLTVVNPSIANQWGVGRGPSELEVGGLLEGTYQAPATKFIGFFGFILAAHAAALAPEDDAEAQKAASDLAMSSFDVIENAEEEEVLYGGITFGFSMNDPFLLREVPGALGHPRVYLLCRLFY